MAKFEYEFDTELSDALKTLSMEAASGPSADFSEMVDSGRGPSIDNVFHKAFVSVDEESTEAAAATGIPVTNAHWYKIVNAARNSRLMWEFDDVYSSDDNPQSTDGRRS